MSERPPQDDDAITLPTSIASDWRLVLHDSITSDTLRQGCLSIFEHVNSGQNLAPIEVNHAVRFLEYAGIHVKYRRYPHNQLLEPLLSEELCRKRNVTSALVKLVCHSSDTLRTAAFSFLDVRFSPSSSDIYPEVAVTDLLPQLIKSLNPLEHPLNGTTTKFHRHLTSILDNFFGNSEPKDVRRGILIYMSPSRLRSLQPQSLDSIFNSSLKYLRTLTAAPSCSADTRPGLLLFSDMPQFNLIMMNTGLRSQYPEIQPVFGEIRKEILAELAKLLGLSSIHEADLCLHSNWKYPKTAEPWLKGFEYLLGRVSEGTQFSDLETLAIALLLSNRPSFLELFFDSDDKFGFKIKDTIMSSSKLDTNSLWTLFTPTQPHHATIIHKSLKEFIRHDHPITFEKQIWNGWFTSFVNAVSPSKLPFTGEFIALHITLIEVLREHLHMIDLNDFGRKCEWKDESRSELDETYRAFYTHTRDYIDHLNLHPFALDDERSDVILNFLRKWYLRDFENSLNKPYREDTRKAMDEVALSSSSPPSILTSELVCHLTDDEVINIVDRIVALLESDSCLDDDTILRICAFHKHQRQYVHLPDLFRKAGRSIEQYFHAFECLLSLPIDYFDRSPVNYLLTSRWDTKPTFDEWDDVDFERVGIVKRVISQNTLPVDSDSNPLNKLLLPFVFEIIPLAPHCAARLCQSQLDRLLAPSVDVLCAYFIRPPDGSWRESKKRKELFVKLCQYCDQRVTSHCLKRTGFFSRFVTAMFDHNFKASEFFFKLIIAHGLSNKLEIEDLITVQRRVPNFLEEGWQDAMESLFVHGKDVANIHTPYKIKPMMRFFGGNVSCSHGLNVTHW
ncbi:hypothetical protein BLNAU_14257 [Blattamonas nauphoetae]|uniref:Uncharacterized protein n=1 Tax=Blattamonas nauphoetae TaxID=2049346 RepID=A0ABQ9XGP0_9EUKA|nr:hypothetical protein BLNAU_14257 [Blattamonas nauphoetae]